MKIESLDHVVLTVRDVQATCEFYGRVLNLDVRLHQATDDAGNTFHFGEMYFGNQKINLHQLGHEFEPKALLPTSGSGDLCFITTSTPDDVARDLRDNGIVTVEGPVPRRGARGAMTSIYLRDPDQNLVEIAHYD